LDGKKGTGGTKMADFIAIAVAVIALYLILKITAKIFKVILFIAAVGIVLYILTNYGFLSGLI